MATPSNRLRTVRTVLVLIACAWILTACRGGAETSTPYVPVADRPVATVVDTPPVTQTPTSTTEAPAPPSTTPPTTATPTTVAEPVVTYALDLTEGPFEVQNVAADDVLNVRSGPGVGNEIIDTLSPNAWNLSPTGNIARVDDTLWREFSLPTGTTGFVHGGFVTASDRLCAQPPVLDALIASYETTGDLDGDGAADYIELLVGNDSVHIEIAFGNGATMRRPLGHPTADALHGVGYYRIEAIDLDGNGVDELQIDTTEGRWTGTAFYRTSTTCELFEYGSGGSVFGLGTYGSAGSPIFWTCRGVGSDDFRIIKTVGAQLNGEMIFTVSTYSFDVSEGFVGSSDAPDQVLTAVEFEAHEYPAGDCAL